MTPSYQRGVTSEVTAQRARGKGPGASQAGESRDSCWTVNGLREPIVASAAVGVAETELDPF